MMQSTMMNSAAVGLGETPEKKNKDPKRSVNGSNDDTEANASTTVTVTPIQKRSNYLEWNDYFMAVASLSAQRSKDPSTQVGACIVNEDNKIVGIGYNGMPIGCSDDILPWAKDAPSSLDTKYPYVCHAEMNAIMNKNCSDVKGCTIYSTLFPCNECAKLIIQSGIRRVIYIQDKPEKNEMIASKTMFKQTGIIFEQFKTEREKVVVNFIPESKKST